MKIVKGKGEGKRRGRERGTGGVGGEGEWEGEGEGKRKGGGGGGRVILHTRFQSPLPLSIVYTLQSVLCKFDDCDHSK